MGMAVVGFIVNRLCTIPDLLHANDVERPRYFHFKGPYVGIWAFVSSFMSLHTAFYFFAFIHAQYL